MPHAGARNVRFGHGLRVLIADDSSAVRSFIAAQLTAHDFVCSLAEDGTRALRLARLLPMALIVTDVNMPGMSGIELIAALRASPDPRVARIPVVLATGDQDPKLRSRGIQAGANGFLTKPVKPEALIAAVKSALTSVPRDG